ncbi:hypothetical protein V8C42DRAFT_310914 [Trichoderma barbatum]
MRLGPFLATRSLEHGATPTEKIPQQTPYLVKPAAQTAVVRDASSVSYAPSPTPTNEPSSQESNGLDPSVKIGLEAGITLGILVVIVFIGLCVYGCRRRNSDEDAEIRSCYVEPGTPHPSMTDLSTQHMYQSSQHQYEAIPNNINPTFGDIQALPTVPQRVPLMHEQWSQPLMNTAELEDGYTWNRYPRISELYPETPSPYRKSVDSRPAELENIHAGNPQAVHLIPRKQVASHVWGTPITR